MRIEEILISGSCLYKIVVFKWTQFLENSGSSQLYTDEHDVARFISKEKKDSFSELSSSKVTTHD